MMNDLTPPRVPQQARSRAKYDALLKAAQELFAEHGYSEATIDAIVERAGVSIGVFYSYFASKRQILLALFKRQWDSSVSTNTGVELPARLTLAGIEATLQHLLRNVQQNSGLRRARQELALIDPEFAHYERGMQEQILTTIISALEQHRADGRLRPDLDCPVCAHVLLTLFFNLRDTLNEFSEEEMQARVSATARLLYHMLVPDNSPI